MKRFTKKKKVYWAIYFNGGRYVIAKSRKTDWMRTSLNGEKYYEESEELIVPVHITPINPKNHSSPTQ